MVVIRLMMWLASLLGLLSCGGGGQATDTPHPEDAVSVYGDSLAAGSYGEPEQRLSPTPAQRLAEYAKRVVVDYSAPGTSSEDALYGSAPAPFVAFDRHIATDPSLVVLLRYGGADAVLGMAADKTDMAVRTLVRLASWAGKRVVITGISHISPQVGDALLASVAERDALLRRIAAETGTPFIDVRGLPFDASTDLADLLHPSRAYSDRITQHIANQLRSIHAP